MCLSFLIVSTLDFESENTSKSCFIESVFDPVASFVDFSYLPETNVSISFCCDFASLSSIWGKTLSAKATTFTSATDVFPLLDVTVIFTVSSSAVLLSP